ncbi:MAG TPA: M3 family oligoendopeptidase [Candidatus Paceibacterota bacterium]|nr:M3 family oligoendopeptidase [Candidatus Paceibacterota bacterium]
MQTKWDLSILYKSVTDPAIERDQKKTDRSFAAFANKYKGNKEHLKRPAALAAALADYEKLIELPGTKALYYVFFRKDLDVNDKGAEALGARLEERSTKRGNQILFFTLELGRLPKEKQEQFLGAKVLAPYRYWLEQLFENAKYDLSEAEEKILSLKSDVSFGRWMQATDNILNKKTVIFAGKTLPLPEAQGMYPTMPTAKRRALYTKVREAYAEVADIAESELNAIYTNKKIDDELRGMKHPYEATIRGYQNDVKSVMALVDAVAESAKISHRFYQVKKKLLGLDALTYADRSAKVGSLKTKMPFEKTVPIVREVFGNLDPLYADMFDRLIANGQVDVHPKAGKTGGAYCASEATVPTFVLLNHTPTFESLKTLAHEMGHAMHAERSRTQRPLYRGHPISTAETASTFFEGAALKHVIATLPPEERMIALHDVIQDDIATVFRQIACFRFEQALHEAIRSKGYVPKEEIADIMNDHMKAYLGPAFTFAREDGYFFVTWSHIRRFFYVYSYAYGQLISKALHEKLAEDSRFIEKVDGFLATGESKSPEAIFAECGLNTKKSDIFRAGLASIERDVAELERLTK